MFPFLHSPVSSERVSHVHILGGIQDKGFCIQQIYLKLYIEVDRHLIKQIAHITSRKCTNLSSDNLLPFKAVLLCLAFQIQTDNLGVGATGLGPATHRNNVYI